MLISRSLPKFWEGVGSRPRGEELETQKDKGTRPQFQETWWWWWAETVGCHSLAITTTPWPAPIDCPFPSAEFQKEAEPEGKKKGKFKTMKVLKLLGNKRDTKSKCPGDRS